MKNEYYPFLDLLKYVCCIGILFIHTKPFEYMPVFKSIFNSMAPVFVSVFFVISSMLFWKKVEFNHCDKKYILHFVKRLLILYVLWSVILLPHWLSPLVEEYPNNWWWKYLPAKILVGGVGGSWFIMMLIYGTLICYILNKYLNHYLVMTICTIVFFYYSLVHYCNMNDFAHVYVNNGGFFDSYYMPMRSIFWIEAGFFFQKVANIQIFLSKKMIMIILIGYILTILQLQKDAFYANAILSIVLPFYLMKFSQNSINLRCIELRKMSIIIYFVHFVLVSLWTYLFNLRFIPYNYGLWEMVGVFAFANFIAYTIVKLSERISCLKYLY